MLNLDKVTYEKLPAPECECVSRFITEEMGPQFESAGSPDGAVYLSFTRGEALGLLDENPESDWEIPLEHRKHIEDWLKSLPYIAELDDHIDLFLSP